MRRAIEMDYGMKRRFDAIKTPACLFYYLDRNLGVDEDIRSCRLTASKSS
jgi:hypothetical protein